MHKLQHICFMADIPTRKYSGRGMFGKECLGIEVDNLGSFMADIMEAIIDTSEVDGDHTQVKVYVEAMEALADAFRNMRTDSLGMGMIIYFPNIPYTKDGDDESAD